MLVIDVIANTFGDHIIKLKNNEQCFVDVFRNDLISVRNNEDIDNVWQETEKQYQLFHEDLKRVFERHRFKNCIVNGCIIPVWVEDLDDEVSALETTYLNRLTPKGDEVGNYFHRGIDQLTPFRLAHKLLPCQNYLPMLKNEVEFEGKLYDTYSNYENWLSIQYGDIWRLPREIGPKHSGEIMIPKE